MTAGVMEYLQSVQGQQAVDPLEEYLKAIQVIGQPARAQAPPPMQMAAGPGATGPMGAAPAPYVPAYPGQTMKDMIMERQMGTEAPQPIPADSIPAMGGRGQSVGGARPMSPAQMEQGIQLFMGRGMSREQATREVLSRAGRR